MKAEKNSSFKGMINDVPFSGEQTYNTVAFLLENIEDQFDISINDPSIVEDIQYFVQTAANKMDDFSYSELEATCIDSINHAEDLSDIVLLANQYDTPDNRWNHIINSKLQDERGYPEIVDAIARSQMSSLEADTSMSNELQNPLQKNDPDYDRKDLYDAVNDFVTDKYMDPYYDDPFEDTYPVKESYNESINEIEPSVFDKKTTVGIGSWEMTTEEFYFKENRDELIYNAFITNGEALWNEDALTNIPNSVPYSEQSNECKEIIQGLDNYLADNDGYYYVDLSNGSINDSHLRWEGSEIINSISGSVPTEEAMYNYLPVALAKGMATNQIPSSEEHLAVLPELLNEDSYQYFKKELEHIAQEYPNQINFAVNKDGIVTAIEPYKDLYQDKDKQSEISALDLKMKDKINELSISKDRDSRPIAAMIKNGVTANEMTADEPETKGAKQFTELLSKKEKENFKEHYLSVEETLMNPNGGLNFTNYDKETKQMMESYKRLSRGGHLANDFNMVKMTQVIQYNMEQRLENVLEKRAELTKTKENTQSTQKEAPKITFSKPKEKCGIER